jgi:hypothetical protein
MIVARQFGFANGVGVIGNVVDGSLTTYWSPLATDFAAYSDRFFVGDPVARVLNVGRPFPALEFDLGEARRVTEIFIKVQDALTLGPAVLIGSDTGATSPADTLQSGDVFLAEYSQAQIVSNRFLNVDAMRDTDIRKRFLRLLQRSSSPDAVAPTPGPPNSFTYDTGGGDYEVPSYGVQFVIEVWGAGAAGGLALEGQDGGDSSVTDGGSLTIVAAGGNKATATVTNSATGAGTGGVASGGNTVNTPGGDGGVPSPSTVAEGYSGKGGDSPSGGAGGDAVFLAESAGGTGSLGLGFTRPPNFEYGNPGVAPGGGGSGRNFYAAAGVDHQKYPGGAGGGYSRHVISRSSGDADPGTILSWAVGDGGVSSKGDGRGAQGRVRFSWT